MSNQIRERAAEFWRWWILWRYPNGLTRWKHCPLCGGMFGTKTWRGLLTHLTMAHVWKHYVRRRRPIAVDTTIRCPDCDTLQWYHVVCDWPPLHGFRCVNGHQWAQWVYDEQRLPPIQTGEEPVHVRI